MLSTQLCIITSPVLASQVQRASPDLSFDHLMFKFLKRQTSVSNAFIHKYMTSTLMTEMHNAVYTHLGPSKIKALSTVTLKQLASRINSLPMESEVGLFICIREHLTYATAFAFWGPENPFALDPSLVKNFWAYDADVVKLMVNILPRFTARKAYYARQRLIKALEEYFRQERYTAADKVIQERFRLH